MGRKVKQLYRDVGCSGNGVLTYFRNVTDEQVNQIHYFTAHNVIEKQNEKTAMYNSLSVPHHVCRGTDTKREWPRQWEFLRKLHPVRFSAVYL